MMKRLSMHSNVPNFIFWGYGGRKGFFSQCSHIHQVPKRFQRALQIPKLFPHDVPSSTSVLSHVLSPQFNFHGYNLGKGNWLGLNEPAPTSFLLGSNSLSKHDSQLNCFFFPTYLLTTHIQVVSRQVVKTAFTYVHINHLLTQYYLFSYLSTYV